jgi:plastocyanin
MTARSLRWALGVVAVGTLLAACGDDDDAGSTATTAAPAASSMATMTTTGGASGTSAPAATTAPASSAGSSGGAAGAAEMAVTVDIKDFKFNAAEVKVAVGGTVTFTNSDSQQHTATSTGGFDTGAIQPGESKTITFDKAGTFAYVCSFHPFMKGTVTVG